MEELTGLGGNRFVKIVAKCHFSLKDRFIVHIGINVDIRMIQNSFFTQTKVNAVIPPYDYIKFCMIRDSIAVWLI